MKILAVGAHPDDVEFGCAPVLIKEAGAGSQVKVLVASRGEASSSGTPEEREMEARRAAQIIGAEIDFLNLEGDCNIAANPGASLKFAREVRIFRPDVVLAPATNENQHPDHIAVGRSVRDATRLARYGGLNQLRDLEPHKVQSLYFYCITQSFMPSPSVLIDVSSVRDLWVETIRCHESQMRTRNYEKLVISRAEVAGAAMGVDSAIPLWSDEPLACDRLSLLPHAARHF